MIQKFCRKAQQNKQTSIDKFLGLIFTIAILVRMLILASHSEEPSKFGPDEATYSDLANWVEMGKPTSDFPNYGPSLYNSSKLFICQVHYLFESEQHQF